MKGVIALLVLVAAVSAVPPRDVVPKFLEVLAAGRPSTRITNGEVAKLGQFKYQVGLLLHLDMGMAWCGGTLIDKRWVMTAAHCTDGVNGVDVHMGYADRANREEPNQQIVYVQKKNIFIHPEWNATALQNDISLLKLPADIDFNEHLQKADLPKKGDTETYANKLAIASGWGRDSDASQSTSVVLRYVEVPVMSNAACNRWYFGSINESQICIKTGSEHKSTCNGDSGGPLVISGTNIVVGATSFGIALGCEKGFPGVFTRVSHHLDWIEKVSGVANK